MTTASATRAPARTAWYKATRPDGTDFYSGTVNYAAACGTGLPVTAPTGSPCDPADRATAYLSLSREPGEALTGAGWRGPAWPCRLFVCTPVGDVAAEPDQMWQPCVPGNAAEASRIDMSWKGRVRSLTVEAEVPAHLALGPNGEAVAAILSRVARLTRAELGASAAAWDEPRAARRAVAWEKAWEAARAAGRGGAAAAASGTAWALTRRAVPGPVRWAAGNAALAGVVRDLITPAQFSLLYGPWASVTGAPRTGGRKA